MERSGDLKIIKNVPVKPIEKIGFSIIRAINVITFRVFFVADLFKVR